MDPDNPIAPRSLQRMREALPQVAEHAVAAIIAEVPAYTGELSGPLGGNIRKAVEVALSGFMTISALPESHQIPGGSRATPAALEGAYQLGRGEARSGRTMEALLTAYRIGARVAWRDLAGIAVDGGLPAPATADFAEMVFAYIDELSAASVSGHADELTTAGQVRIRLRERLASHLLRGAPTATLERAADRVEWPLPHTLTAVLVPDSQLRAVLTSLSEDTLTVTEDLTATELLPALLVDQGAADWHREAAAGFGEWSAILVPDAQGPGRTALLRHLHGRRAVVGPARPPGDVRTSYDRCSTVLAVSGGPDPPVPPRGLVDTEDHLATLVLRADVAAVTDLRGRVLAPLEKVRTSTRDKLVETLRAWLLHQGRREDIATALFVHPQTVRYRMGQLRDAYGPLLEDPDFIRDATIALA